MRALFVVILAACGRPAAEPEQPAPIVEPPVAPGPEPAAKMAVPVAPAGARVFFVSPADGATVTSPVKLVFGVEGIAVKPAGDLTPSTGHHHLIISDAATTAGMVVPKDDTHIHYGQGQTEAEVPLPLGTHKLTMQFADGSHISYGEPLAATITVTVAETP
jgi:hypothetical protein